jgi:hypothetical protein
MSNNNVKKSKIGRPSVDTEAVTLRLPRATLEYVDNFRRTEEDIPSRPEAIRRLLDRGIRATFAAAEVQGLEPLDIRDAYGLKPPPEDDLI